MNKPEIDIRPALELLGNSKGRILLDLQNPPVTEDMAFSRLSLLQAHADRLACQKLCSSYEIKKFPGHAALIVRATLELLVNHLFIYEDFPVRYKWYRESGLDDLIEKYGDYVAQYANNPR